MADVLKEFLVSVGFAADESQAKKVEATIAKTEAGITATQTAEAAKRTATEGKAGDARVTIAEALTRFLNLEEQKLSDAREKARKQDAERDKKAGEEAAKKAQERRESAVKSMQAGALKLAAFAAKAIAAIEGTALGIVFAADKAAKSMERLNYTASMMGASAKGVTAVEYAVSQLGGSIEGAHTSLKNFGDRMRLAPEGTIALLDSLHVQTRDAQGNILATDKLWSNLMDNLAKRPYREGMLRAEGIGTDEQTFRAATNPRFHQLEQEQRRIQGDVGADADDAAKSGTAFEQSLRKVEEVITAIKTKVETGVFKELTPELDKLGTWAQANGGHIADVLGRIVRDIIRLSAAVLNRLAKLDWDGILTKAEDFVTRFDNAMTGAFGANGGTILALTAFAVAVGAQVLGPLRAVIATIEAMQKLPLVGRLLGVGAAAVAVGAMAESTPGAGIPADAAERAKVADENKRATDEANKKQGYSGSLLGDTWTYLKRKFGMTSGAGEDRRVKDAILQTAESTKKLVEKAETESGVADTFGTPSNTGASGTGAPSLRRGRGSDGQYRRTPGGGGGRSYADTPSGQGRAGSVKGSEGDRAMQAMRYLVDTKGYTPEGAAIAIGNAIQESGVNPNGKPGDPNTPGGSHYMFQWNNGRNNDTVNGRRAKYERWARENHRDVNDYRTPLDFFDIERNQRTGLEAQWHQQRDLKNAGRLGHLFEGYGDNSEGTRVQNARNLLDKWKQGELGKPTAQAPVPASTSEKAVTDAEVFAARQRLAAGGRDPKDIALRDRYLKEQNTPKSGGGQPAKVEIVKPVPGLTDLHKSIQHYAAAGTSTTLHHPLGVTPAMHAAIDNSRRRGDTSLAKTENYHFYGGDGRHMLAEARRTAGRGNADLIRNLQTAEV